MLATLYHLEGVDPSKPHAMLMSSRIPLMHLLIISARVNTTALDCEMLFYLYYHGNLEVVIPAGLELS